MKNKQPRQTTVGWDARIVNGQIYFEDVRQCALDDDLATDILDDKHLTAIRVVSLQHNWFERAFIDVGVTINDDIKIEMTLRKERRGLLDHWYAYRRVFGTLHKRYVGHSDQINEQKLLKVAQSLPSV